LVAPLPGRPAGAAPRPDAPRRESAPKVASLDPGGDLVASVIAASAGGDRAARVKLAGAAGN